MELRQRESVSEERKNGMKKCCCDCKATRTPLWRAGPAGPKSLCNACGIRYRRKRSTNMAFKKEHRKDKLEGDGGKCGNLVEDLKARLVALGKEEVVLQRQRSPIKRQIRRNVMTKKNKKKMGEVEQAACLLMAMSCGSLFCLTFAKLQTT